jgi:hypothetical protein
MGFTIKFNTILRYEPTQSLVVGHEYAFHKSGLNLIGDDLQIWLARADWTALAEIQVISQTRAHGKTDGRFMVKHVYLGHEQEALTAIFRRMYGWD